MRHCRALQQCWFVALSLKLGERGLIVLQAVLLLGADTMDATILSSSQASQIPFWHDFSTGWGFFALRDLDQTIFGLQSSRHMNQARCTDSVACTLSRYDSCDFFLYAYLKGQVIYKLPQNIHDFIIKLCEAIANIAENTAKHVQKP